MSSTTRRRFVGHTNPLNIQAQRKRELGHIHQGRAALGWTEDDYRFHLATLTSKTSSADLDAAGRATVLAHMAKLGFTPKGNTFKPFDQAAKIKWFWSKLDKAGGLRDASAQSLLAFVGRTAGMEVSDVKFLPVREASAVIEALKSMLRRAEQAQKVGGAA